MQRRLRRDRRTMRFYDSGQSAGRDSRQHCCPSRRGRRRGRPGGRPSGERYRRAFRRGGTWARRGRAAPSASRRRPGPGARTAPVVRRAGADNAPNSMRAAAARRPCGSAGSAGCNRHSRRPPPSRGQALQDAAEAVEELFSIFAAAPRRVEVHDARRIGPAPGAVVAGPRPQPTGFRPAAARIEHRRASRP